MIPIVGYEHVSVNGANVLVARSIATTAREILEHDTLYSYAASVPHALVFQGRAPVYAIPLPPLTGRVAVRHVMRGGFAGRLLHDRFLPPTRVARELTAAFRLRLGGVPTPEVLAVGTYPAGGFFRRADVVTRFVEGSADLSAVFADARNDAQRHPILDAVAKLLSRLTATGAQHPDLNLKNVLITSGEDGYVAHILDVDRVHFHVPGDPLVARANMARLMRSLRQWRSRLAQRNDALTDDDMSYLVLAAAAQPA
ncbi:MAG: hypothetical protein M3R65_10050 [Gemmatimonadota bacterium]|nr:hypothetical protein [Gemmatimonadota bacterium]